MLPEFDDISEIVAMAVESAMAPMRERVAIAETEVKSMHATLTDLRQQVALRSTGPVVDTSLYERVAVVESKQAVPPVADPALADLRDRLYAVEQKSTPTVAPDLYERLAVTEELIKGVAVCRDEIAGINDRLVEVEHAPAPVPVVAPPPIDPMLAVAPVLERVAVTESRLNGLCETVKALDGVRDRLHVVETKAAQGPERYELQGVTGADMDAITERVLRLEIADSAPQATDHGLHDRVRALESAPAPVDTYLRERVTALSVLPERIAAAEAQLASLPDVQKAVEGLRDRQVALETKAALTVPETDVRDHLVALSPALERISTVEAHVSDLREAQKTAGEFNDRLVRLETTTSQPVTVDVREPRVDLAPVQERLATVETRLDGLAEAHKSIDLVRDRLVAVETKAGSPFIPAVPDHDLRDRVVALEVKVSAPNSTDASVSRLEVATVELRQATDTIRKDVAVISERVAVAEVRAFTPGPAGAPGRDGINGSDGQSGTDGVGFDDLVVVQQDERSFAVKAMRGDHVKDIGTVTFPVEIYRGVWQAGRQYDKGDCVTFGGSEFHCNETTMAKPEDGTKAFTLKVKRGRDGKDGKDGGAESPSTPVVRLR